MQLVEQHVIDRNDPRHAVLDGITVQIIEGSYTSKASFYGLSFLYKAKEGKRALERQSSWNYRM